MLTANIDISSDQGLDKNSSLAILILVVVCVFCAKNGKWGIRKWLIPHFQETL